MNYLERILIERGHDCDTVYWLCTHLWQRIEHFESVLETEILNYDDCDEDDEVNVDVYGKLENIVTELEELKEAFIEDVEDLPYAE